MDTELASRGFARREYFLQKIDLDNSTYNEYYFIIDALTR